MCKECGRDTWEVCPQCGGEYCSVHIDDHKCREEEKDYFNVDDADLCGRLAKGDPDSI